ncbi:MAG: hypothetical protein H6747_15560 [Deltaproteobacteria bacterium]|nr:hypothetical protein [Deltaproteobacteria bacterium]
MSSAIIRCPNCGQLNRIPAERRAQGPRCGRCKNAIAAKVPVGVIDDAGLDALVAQSPVPVLVDFYADWCGPCRMLGPVLQGIAEEYDGRLIVVKVDTERSRRWAQRLGVQGIPAVHLFKAGKHVAAETGARPAPHWRQFLAPHLV